MEFTNKQIRRIDEVQKAVYECCKTLTNLDDALPWDIDYIGEIADAACDILVDKGFKVWYPVHITIPMTGEEYITDWHRGVN